MIEPKLQDKDFFPGPTGKNCFDGYLTSECRDCPFWENSEHSVGCAKPGPISRCEAHMEMERARERAYREKGAYQ